MAVNQAQGENKPATAPTGTTDERLSKLQDDMDLLKASIKKLLIDIRERMNELENPFVHAPARPVKDGKAARKEAAGGEEEGEPESPASEEQGALEKEENADDEAARKVPPLTPGGSGTRGPVENQIMQMMKEKGMGLRASSEKLRLQKVHRLFEWTSKIVNRYGHDRLDMMLQAYGGLGYITRESVAQVQEIARLMPATLGEIHNIGPDAFVSELYVLNRILDPSDTSLDRDMIEVLMASKRGEAVAGPAKPQKVAEDVDEWLKTLDQI
jgi:archaellum component FlaD/FlaE